MNRPIFNILAFGLFFFASQANAQSNADRCKNNAAYDTYGIGDKIWSKTCKSFLTTFTSIETTVSTMMPEKVELTASGGDYSEISANAAAASENQAQKLKAAEYAKTAYTKLGSDVESRMDKFDEVTPAYSAKLSAADRTKFETVAKNTKKELQGIRDEALARATVSSQLAAGFSSNVSGLDYQSEDAAARAARLRAEQEQAGNGKVSRNTKVALIGGAAIAAGTVGGLYLVGNHLVKKADEKAEARIKQAEDAANGVIDNVESSVVNMVQVTTTRVDQVLANAEDTGNRIMDKAKNDVNNLIPNLTSDMNNAFSRLSIEKIEKLNIEINNVLNELIAKANSENNQLLADKLTQAKNSINRQIQEELQRRQDAILNSNSSIIPE